MSHTTTRGTEAKSVRKPAGTTKVSRRPRYTSGSTTSHNWSEARRTVRSEERKGTLPECPHRALADILESIRELAYYRQTLFVPEPGPDSAQAQAASAAVVAAFAPVLAAGLAGDGDLAGEAPAAG